MIYLITVEGQNYCKIGFTSNVEKRLSAIQTSNPFKCTVKYVITGDVSREKSLHERFKKYRLNGEWFSFNEEINNYFFNSCNDTSQSYRVSLNVKEMMKRNIFMGFDRVGQFNLMFYIGVKSNLDNMTWKFTEVCLKDNNITISTFNNYIKVLIKHKVIRRGEGGIYNLNRDLFKYSLLNN